jgi:hypothetical protein
MRNPLESRARLRRAPTFKVPFSELTVAFPEIRRSIAQCMHKNHVTGQHVGSAPMARPFSRQRKPLAFQASRASFHPKSRCLFALPFGFRRELSKDTFLECAMSL